MASQRPAETRRPAPRLYLVAPQDAPELANQLADALGAADIAAVLLRLPATDERGQVNHVKALAPTVQNRGTALLLDGHPDLAARAGADGSHLSGIEALASAIATLKPARIAGCGGLETRHEAMRTEQQMIRDWVDSQAQQHRDVRRLLEILVREDVNK